MVWPTSPTCMPMAVSAVLTKSGIVGSMTVLCGTTPLLHPMVHLPAPSRVQRRLGLQGQDSPHLQQDHSPNKKPTATLILAAHKTLGNSPNLPFIIRQPSFTSSPTLLLIHEVSVATPRLPPTLHEYVYERMRLETRPHYW